MTAPMRTNGDRRAIIVTCADLMARLVFTAHHKVAWKDVPKKVDRDAFMDEATAMLAVWEKDFGEPSDTSEITSMAMYWAEHKWSEGHDRPLTEGAA